MRIRTLILWVLLPLFISVYLNKSILSNKISFSSPLSSSTTLKHQQQQQHLFNKNNFVNLLTLNNNNDLISTTNTNSNNTNTNILGVVDENTCTTSTLLPQNQASTTTINKEFIVMFNKYYKQEDHYKIIESILNKNKNNVKRGDEDNQYKWKIIKRNNPASTLPSDFALLQVTIPQIQQKRYIEKDIAICSTEKGIYNQECDILFKGAIGDLIKHRDIIKNVYPDRKIYGMETLSSVEKARFNDDLDETPATTSFDPPTSIVSRVPYGRIHDDIPEVKKEQDREGAMSSNSKRQLFAPDTTRASSVTMLDVESMWMNGFTGNKTVVAIFDTGLNRRSDYPFNNVVMETDWTGKKSTSDYLGHGTFVAGIIASNLEGCPGLAQDSELYIYKVFSDEKESFTSWFLDAFNHAIQTKVDVLNLSIGGKDYMDRPFVEKIREVTANRITVVSAMGNDGPLYGTLSNPADQSDVIGVGSINFNGAISEFSSRGMTTWELPEGYGRVKPDVVTYGNSIYGLKYDRCQAVLYGTSLSAPVVTGAISLLLSSLTEEEKEMYINPAFIKQVLLESAEPTKGANIFEQGRGALSVLGAYKRLKQNIQDLRDNNRTGKLLLHPNRINYEECPYFWPYCTQPLYYSAIPTIFNVTLLNGMDVYGKIRSVTWEPAINGHFLDIGFSYDEEVYPFSGHVGIHVSVKKEAEFFGGMVSGYINITVDSGYSERIALPLNIRVIPTPPRQKRILWDQFHSLKYPLGYFPVDEIDMMPKVKTFDWDGDHPHTNFKQLYEVLRKNGYYIEVLGSPLTCFDPLLYGSLLIIDPEEEFHPSEIKKIEEDVRANGLNLIVIGDWYNVDILQKIQFHDKKSNRHWIPVTGGSNIPAINDLLSSFNIVMGDSVYDGDFSLGGNLSYYSSGTSIVGFPQGGLVVQAALTDQTRQILNGRTSQPTVPILGFYQTKEFNVSFNSVDEVNSSSKEGVLNTREGGAGVHKKYLNNENSDSLEPATGGSGSNSNPSSSSLKSNILSSDSPTSIQSGQVVVFGDSSCFDESTHCFESGDCNSPPKKNCFWVMENILDILQGRNVLEIFPEAKLLTQPLTPLNEQTNKYEIPLRPSNNGDIEKYSKVTSQNAFQTSAFQQCYNQLYTNEKYRWHNLHKYENVSWSQRSSILPSIPQQPNNPSPTINENNNFNLYYFIPYIFVMIALLLLFVHFTKKKQPTTTSNSPNSGSSNNNNSSSISISTPSTTSPTLQRLISPSSISKSDVDV